MTLPELIAALEAADGPSRDLDAEIAQTLDPALIRPTVITRDGSPPGNHFADTLLDPRQTGYHQFVTVPAYTTSVDAALSLIPARCELGGIERHVQWEDGLEREYGVIVNHLSDAGNYAGDSTAGHDHLAMAICVATLRAIKATTQPDHARDASRAIGHAAETLARCGASEAAVLAARGCVDAASAAVRQITTGRMG